MSNIDQFIKNINWCGVVLFIPAWILVIYILFPFSDIGVGTTNSGWMALASTNTTGFATLFSNENIILNTLAKVITIIVLAHLLIFSILTSENEKLAEDAFKKWISKKSDMYMEEDKEEGWL